MRELAGLWRAIAGLSSVEYALLLAFIAGGIIIAADALSGAVGIELNEKAKCLRDSTSVYVDPSCNN